MVVPYFVFPTCIGSCAIAWNPLGVVAFRLPELSEEQTALRLKQRLRKVCETKPPDEIKAIIRRVKVHLDGKPQDFSCVRLDLTGVADFSRRVYLAAQAIPPGTIRTYGEIASHIGSEHAARAVGQALGRNPIALIVPCHRVVAANGKPGGFSAYGGLSTKEKMLLAEGVNLAWSPLHHSRSVTTKSVFNATK